MPQKDDYFQHFRPKARLPGPPKKVAISVTQIGKRWHSRYLRSAAFDADSFEQPTVAWRCIALHFVAPDFIAWGVSCNDAMAMEKGTL
jgi:hypothetical protein